MPKTFAMSDPSDRPEIDTFTLVEREPIEPDDDDYDTDAGGEQYRDIEHLFHLLEPPDSAKMMSLNLASRFHDSSSRETKMRAVHGTIDYLAACLSPEEYDDLYDLLVNPRARGMDMDILFDMCRWVIEVTTDRPTSRSTGSRRGQSTASKNSTAGSPSKARRRS